MSSKTMPGKCSRSKLIMRINRDRLLLKSRLVLVLTVLVLKNHLS